MTQESEPIQFVASIPDIQTAISISGDGSSRVKLDMPASEVAQVIRLLTVCNQRLRVHVVIDDTLTPQPQPEPPPTATQGKEKPFGQIASSLYRTGFFYVPQVLEAIGTDDEFLEWVRHQPCAITGGFDISTDGGGNELRRCDPAHVSRLELGRGMNLKPPYAAIPLIHEWHAKQHQYGESIFADGDAEKGRAWMQKKRNEYVMKWAAATLARSLDVESLGWLQPVKLVEWARLNQVSQYLPQEYRDAVVSVPIIFDRDRLTNDET